MCGCSPKIAKAGNKVSSAALRSLAVSVESCAKTTTSLLKAGFNVTPKSSRRTSSSIAVMTHTGALRGPGVSPVSSITPLAMLSQSSTNSTSGSRCTPRASSIVAGFRSFSSANEYRRSACHACERQRPTVHEKRYVTAMYRVYLHPRALTPRSRTQGTAPQSSLCPDGCLPLLLSRKTLTSKTKEHGKNMPTICYGQSEINENTANV